MCMRAQKNHVILTLLKCEFLCCVLYNIESNFCYKIKKRDKQNTFYLVKYKYFFPI